MMKFLIYKITNMVNGKIYIRAHQTENINDNYMGSGKLIRKAIAKYGTINFSKEIIHECANDVDMYAKEKELVTEQFVLSPNTYNMKIGGTGGFSPEARKLGNIAGHKALREKYGENYFKDSYKDKKAKLLSPEAIAKSNKSKKEKFGTNLNSWNIGSKRTQESKNKMSQAKLGTKNKRFGTIWIYNEEERRSIVIPNTELVTWLEQGWIKGRKIKFG